MTESIGGYQLCLSHFLSSCMMKLENIFSATTPAAGSKGRHTIRRNAQCLYLMDKSQTQYRNNTISTHKRIDFSLITLCNVL